MTHTLLAIAVSHYCEKVRWALDLKGIDYKEVDHLPVAHVFAARRLGGHRTVPVLQCPDGRVFNDSTAILKYLDSLPGEPRFYPEDPDARSEVEKLEDRFDEKLGPASRRMAYFYALPNKSLTLELFRGYGPAWQFAIFKIAYPLVAGIMRRSMAIDRAGFDRSRERVDAIFSELSAQLSDGRRFLVGDQLSAADLAFAALAAPLLNPPEYFVPLPAPERLDAELHALVRHYRATLAGEFALRLFRELRRPNSSTANS